MDRPKATARREGWIKYADALEAEAVDQAEQLAALTRAAQSGPDGELVRQLRRRVHQLTSGKG